MAPDEAKKLRTARRRKSSRFTFSTLCSSMCASPCLVFATSLRPSLSERLAERRRHLSRGPLALFCLSSLLFSLLFSLSLSLFSTETTKELRTPVCSFARLRCTAISPAFNESSIRSRRTCPRVAAKIRSASKPRETSCSRTPPRRAMRG